MPSMRPGVMKYATATKAVWHGDPVVEGGSNGEAFPGIAVKQKAPGSGAGSGTPQKQIAVGEPFAIISKGVVYVRTALISSPAVGDTLYIAAATNVLAKTDNGAKFGVIIELAGTRGCPVGKCRVDLDMKDTF